MTTTREARPINEQRYDEDHGTVLLTGVQAAIRGIIDQVRTDGREGRRTGGFVSGYPGSPLAGFDREMDRNVKRLTALDIEHRPAVNEELALTSVFGSQMVHTMPGSRVDGVVGVWYGKSPGLDRAADALRHANYIGVGPASSAVAVVGDDPANKSSALPSASHGQASDAYVPVLSPGSPQEALDLIRHASYLSRASGLWTALRMVTTVADAAGSVSLDPSRVRAAESDYWVRHTPDARLMAPYSSAMEEDILRRRLPAAERYLLSTDVNSLTVPTRDAWLGIVASGRNHTDVMSAFAEMGLDDAAVSALGIRVWRLGAVWPIPTEQIREFAAGLERVLVVEDKRAFIESRVKEALYGTAGAPVVLGKTDDSGKPLLSAALSLEVPDIALAVASQAKTKVVLPTSATDRIDAYQSARRREMLTLVPTRTAYFCSGCPHNRSTQVPEGTLVSAGVGCHLFTVGMDERFGEVTGITQMGGEGAQFIGMEPFADLPHPVQNVGDGTFFHSGYLALRAAISAGSNITFKLLYNSAVGMTGGQPVAGATPIDALVDQLLAEGASKVAITTEDPKRYRRARLPRQVRVHHRDKLDEVQRELFDTPGVSVLIHDQECAAERRRRRKKEPHAGITTRVVIDERVCEGCGDCASKSNCLSLQTIDTPFGQKTRVHQASCNADYSCLLGDCPSFVTVSLDTSVTPKKRQPPAAPAVPSPQQLPMGGPYTVRMPGVGGTGVVTASQVLAAAAIASGYHVASLDQTGAAQKGGQVVSDVTISADPDGTGKASPGGVDLYLALDPLVAMTAAHLVGASRERTRAVVNLGRTDTGQMLAGRAAHPADDEVRRQIDAVTRPEGSVYADFIALSQRLFGDHMPANIMALGAASQAGLLPLSADALCDAIRLNGASVDLNLAAFGWGRAVVAAPEKLPSVTDEKPPVAVWATEAIAALDLPAGVADDLAMRMTDLSDYQSRAYAARYQTAITALWQAERSHDPSAALTRTAGKYLHKLMTYKDEYEVARLHLMAAGKDRPGAGLPEGRWKRPTYHLAPPILKDTKLLRNKLKLKYTAPAVFGALRALRGLRGTAFDPFGRFAVRRVERRIGADYERLVTAVAERLRGPSTPEELAALEELLASPDVVRGYEDVKLRNVAEYEDRLRRLSTALEPPLLTPDDPSELTKA
ncbi:indolepyruvate ferredoxin oxidoreductase family protein [Streptomyces sp. NPDC056296]|uniref:indolepyruvate ferredoxin oxidoreductase family protein n=1 Tax=Streptomyces sp. NPDC056296 TaxID=3345775 RepID=UPI0035D71576